MSSAPVPVVIVSLPWPPTTMLRPLPASIVSSEPMSGSTVVNVEVYVHGTGAYGTVGTVGRLPAKLAKSPNTMSSPLPVVMWSPPVPPTTQFLPEPLIVIVSAPPAVGSVASMKPVVRSALHPAWPLSPKTMLLPSAIVIVSSSTPPKTRSLPAPSVIRSLPPIVGEIVAMRPTVIGSVPKRSMSEEAERTCRCRRGRWPSRHRR